MFLRFEGGAICHNPAAKGGGTLMASVAVPPFWALAMSSGKSVLAAARTSSIFNPMSRKTDLHHPP